MAQFVDPPKSGVVILDAVSSQYLSKLVLEGIPHAVLPARREFPYLSFAVAGRWLLNLRHIDWASVVRRRGRGLAGQLYMLYVLACLQLMEPKVVLTFIDNNWIFHRISRLMKGVRFAAVQNGGRSVGCVSVPRYMPLPDPGYKISMPLLFSFGRYEPELYRRFGHQVDEFRAAGSLIGGYYKTAVSPGRPAVEHDLCYISQWQDGCMNGSIRPKLKQALLILDAHLARYVKERGLSLVIARRWNEPGEPLYFRSVFGAGVKILENEAENFSSYRAMDGAGVVVAHCSTAGEEALGWGKKVLFCNLLRDEEFYLPPRPGPWLVDSTEYEAFAGKLDALRAMSDREWKAASEDFAKYSVSYDFDNPAHKQIRELVLSTLKA